MPSNSAPRYVIGLDAIGADQVGAVGGKAAGLAALSSLPDVVVPPGVCVTTAAYARCVADDPEVAAGLAALAGAGSAAGLRAALAKVTVPDDIVAALAAGLGPGHNTRAYAVRSSATAEDLPGASFAGQHDSFLEVQGLAAVLDAIRRCWASLFTDRAIAYRRQHDLDAHDVQMAVVVQEMIAGQAAGVMFTADPLSGRRQVVCIESVAGRGDDLVAGRAAPSTHRVVDNAIVERAGPQPAPLTDPQVHALCALGARIEAHRGAPQDVEWVWANGAFYIVQSRPITALFPVPAVDDGALHVYLSVGHQQMMTEPFKPLGLSVWQMTTPAPMAEAGGRLFVDVTRQLSDPAVRPGFLRMAGRADPLVRDAFETLVARDGFLPPPPAPPAGGPPSRPPPPAPPDFGLVPTLIAESRDAVAALSRELARASGPAVFATIRADVERLRHRLFDPRGHALVIAAFESTWWLNDHLAAWLDQPGAADALAQAAPHNVVADMALALLDLADEVRAHPAVIAHLEAHEDDLDQAWSTLPDVAGGPAVRAALDDFLAAYGMRGVGEIDITRPRWVEQPGALVPTVLGHVRHLAPGERARVVARGRAEAAAAERRVLDRLAALPDGAAKAAEAKGHIDRLRATIGYREYPKHEMVSRYALYKAAMVREAAGLVGPGGLCAADDAFFLRFDELEAAVATGRVDRALIAQRQAAYRAHKTLVPPRVLTSDGEMVRGRYRRDDAPAGALVGLPVSSGTVEGRARVLSRMADADLAPGDILVTRHTDPSWSPVFVRVAGLVTEVGGLMTHGAVVAREVGLPAVVGVQGATQMIQDGQMIRLNGTAGWVELLPVAEGESGG